MDLFLNNITGYYVAISCFLIGWGLFAIHALYEVIDCSIKQRCSVRKLDVLYMCGLSVTTTLLLCCLAIFINGIATQFILHLFLFEVWYILFAIFFTMHYLSDCMTYTASSHLLDEIRSH